jgi:looped-hinge helix DNA binding domain, AbrB family
MRLHEHTDFAAFITASAAEHDLSEPFVEKDYWITEILRVTYDRFRSLPPEWYSLGMRSTIDKAGRLVIPKRLRDDIGLRPGEVEVTVEGASLRVQPLAGESLDERDGRLVIPAGGAPIDDDLVRALRDAGQR